MGNQGSELSRVSLLCFLVALFNAWLGETRPESEAPVTLVAPCGWFVECNRFGICHPDLLPIVSLSERLVCEDLRNVQMPQKGTATPVFSHSQTKRICAITFLLFIVACYPIPSRRNHYPSAAGTQAQLFAEIAFVQRNFTRAYELLSQSAKERGSTDQLREFIAKNHSSTYPLFVSATDYEPMPGQDKIMIYLYGENGDERFYYRMVLVGLAENWL